MITGITRSGSVFAALAVAVVAWPLTVLTFGIEWDSEPVNVVEDYLNAVNDGDVAAAKQAAGITKSDTKGLDTSFLTAKALSHDWELDSVVDHGDSALLYDSENEELVWQVQVTLRSGALASRGMFYVREADGKFDILNPFNHLSAENLPFTFLELNKTTAKLPPDYATEDDSGRFALFPGFYRFYEKTRELAVATPSSALLIPSSGGYVDEPEELAAAESFVNTTIALTAEGRKAAEAALRDRIDTCVASDDLKPKGCPFAAVDSSDYHGVEVGLEYYSDVKDVKWEVKEYPDVIPVLDAGSDGELTFDVRSTGSIELTATDVKDADESEKSEKFTAVCEFMPETVTARLSASGTFSVSSPNEDGYGSPVCR